MELGCREDSEHSNVLLLVGHDNSLVVYPDLPAARSAVDASLELDMIRFYLTNGIGSRTIRGYVVKPRTGVSFGSFFTIKGTL